MYKQFIPISDEERKKIWNDSYIVLDTNVLLHLYRYDNILRNKLFGILKTHQDKANFIIPYIVIYEFFKNRPRVMIDQWNIEAKINSIIRRKSNEIREEIHKAFPSQYHPYIEINKLNKILNKFEKKTQKYINLSKEANYTVELNEDEILAEILNIFNDMIDDELSEDELTKIYTDGEERFKEKVPPGYEDDEKEGISKYSDLVIWKTIIKISKNTNKNIIFVTDDQKEDWWKIVSGKTVGPRPELIEEFITETNKSIIFYKSNNFYSYFDKQITNENELTPQDNEQLDRISIDSFFEGYARLGNSQLSTGHSLSGQVLSGSLLSGVDLDDYSELIHERKNQKLKRRNYTVDEIIDWFHEHYDNPANGVPYESAEGGYIYALGGGPYSTRDIIEDNFNNTKEMTRETVINLLEEESYEWIKKGIY